MRDLNLDEFKAVFGGGRLADTSILPQPSAAVAKPVTLTPRQAQCLDWVAAGKTSKEIAIVLGLSPLTVDTYIRTACRSLNVRTRAEATAARKSHKIRTQS